MERINSVPEACTGTVCTRPVARSARGTVRSSTMLLRDPHLVPHMYHGDPVWMTQNTGSRPGKTRRLDSSDSESVGPLACPCACNRALVVTGTVPGDAGVTVFLQRLTGTRACSNLNSASPTRARCNSQTLAADSAVARRRLDGIKTQDGPDLKKLKFHAHAHVLAPHGAASKR